MTLRLFCFCCWAMVHWGVEIAVLALLGVL